VIGRIVENVDVLLGTKRICRRDWHCRTRSRVESKLDPRVFVEMIDRVVQKHPHVKVVATTLREVHSTNRHSWSAVAWMNGKTYTAPTAEWMSTIAWAVGMFCSGVLLWSVNG